jgi:quinoprotein glucose dehydrogenase
MTYEADVCIIGGGMTGALFAVKLTELRPAWSIVVVEAGGSFAMEGRGRARERMLRYGEDPWPGDRVEGRFVSGSLLHTAAVGGASLQWGATCNRFSQEDLRLRSLYGLSADWPIEWEDLEQHYCEAERRIGVAGEPSPYPEDRRSEPYPMPPLALTSSLGRLKDWAEQSGVRCQSTPQAKNSIEGYDGRPKCSGCGTCYICPTGAKYSADFTIRRLCERKQIVLHDRTLVRRLVPDQKSDRVVAALAMRTSDAPSAIEYRARVFVVAAGTGWSSHLLLASTSSHFPNGLANTSGLVGRFMNGHPLVTATVELDFAVIPESPERGIMTRHFLRCPLERPYIRHDLRIGEHPQPAAPQIKAGDGDVLTGNRAVAAFRASTHRGVATLRAYYDAHPAEASALTHRQDVTTAWGEPAPVIRHLLDDASRARARRVRDEIRATFERMARLAAGRLLSIMDDGKLYHQGGGCRMGRDPATSVCDSFGRTHDCGNLFVIGAPTLPTAGCTNGTLTFVALSLRSAAEVSRGAA